MAPLVLLAEDEVLVREVLREALADAGFDIVVAENGLIAEAELEKDAARFGAVVTDINAGAGPSGWEIGQRARELVADMPIVYMSGDSSHDWSSKGVPNSLMVSKPFVPAQIITAVTTLMNENSTR